MGNSRSRGRVIPNEGSLLDTYLYERMMNIYEHPKYHLQIIRNWCGGRHVFCGEHARVGFGV